MKNLLIIFCFLFMSHCFSQTGKEIKTLDFANNEIKVPENCEAKSKFELSDCNGFSVQWEHLSNSNFKLASRRWFKEYGKDSKSKTPINVTSFGAVLKGYMFTYNNPDSQNRLIVYGTVNKQPLILNVASEDELISFSSSNSFLNKLIVIPK